MPVIGRADLELRTANDQQTTIIVRYMVRFSRFERFLAENGLSFVEAIRVQGVDPGGSPAATTLHTFPLQAIPVLDGDGDAPRLERRRTLTVPRSSLQATNTRIRTNTRIWDIRVFVRIRVFVAGFVCRWPRLAR